jgi:hypothetical protein
MKILITQIKRSTESLPDRIKQVENRVSGIKDKLEELDQSDKDKGKH